MTIGIDIRVLGSPSKSGIEEYTENLLAHMLPLDKSIKYKLFYSSFGNELNTYDWLLLKNIEVHKFKLPNKLLFLSSNFVNRPQIDRLMGGVDVFFSPHFFLTSLSPACKRVTTFHDLSYLHFPEFFSRRKNIWHKFEMKPEWQSRFSNRIITVSESTKNDLINFYDIDPAKVDVIYSGISPNIRRLPEEQIKSFKHRNNLPENYILYLGKLEPRKNIVSLIKAFDIVKKNLENSHNPDSSSRSDSSNRFNGSSRSDSLSRSDSSSKSDSSNRAELNSPRTKNLHLIIAGSRGWLDKEIFETAKDSPNKNHIIFKDNISDELRAGYYSSASVFVYPSFFEGFGFPPLEAMACGTPVITSFNSSLPEVVGGASLLVDPTNIYDIAGSISSILTDEALKNQIIDKGYKRASEFNWHKTASKTLECLLK